MYIVPPCQLAIIIAFHFILNVIIKDNLFGLISSQGLHEAHFSAFTKRVTEQPMKPFLCEEGSCLTQQLA